MPTKVHPDRVACSHITSGLLEPLVDAAVRGTEQFIDANKEHCCAICTALAFGAATGQIARENTLTEEQKFMLLRQVVEAVFVGFNVNQPTQYNLKSLDVNIRKETSN